MYAVADHPDDLAAALQLLGVQGTPNKTGQASR